MILQAKDLMIGDWIMFPNSIEKVQEVAYVEGKGYCASFAASATLFPIPIDKLKPIPITAEILKKNGFVYKEREETCATEEYHIWSLVNTSFFLDDDSWWRKEKDGILRIKFGISKIKFLHELQHALKLCGIEKEIIL